MTAAAALMVTYLGTACFLLEVGGTRILTDPGDFLTNRFTVEEARGLSEPDLILVSHGDFDHVNRLEYVPGSRQVPILAPEAVKAAFPGYHVRTEETFVLGDVTVRAFPSVHGFFHSKDHRGYLIGIGGLKLCFLGDACRIDPAAVEIAREPDLLFVTIGGFETNVENALRNVALLKPKTVVPMHWETVWRIDGKAREFLQAMKERFPSVACVIPGYGAAFSPPPVR